MNPVFICLAIPCLLSIFAKAAYDAGAVGVSWALAVSAALWIMLAPWLCQIN